MPGTFKSEIHRDSFTFDHTLTFFTMGLPQAVNDKEMSGQFKKTNIANTAWQSSTVILFSQCPSSPTSKSVSYSPPCQSGLGLRGCYLF